MTDPAAYGDLFRQAYATLHGGLDEGVAMGLQRRPDEPLEEFLARTRREALLPLLHDLQATPPPAGLEEAHRLLLAAIECAMEADAALAAQVRAYGCGDYQTSLEHSQRAADLARRAVELDRALIAALWRAEEAAPGTLASLGIAQVLSGGAGHRP